MPRPLALATTLSLFAAVMATPSSAAAKPRDDMRGAYATALDQFNNLEIDAAISTVDSAISNATSGGSGDDPVLASLYVLKAALIYSNEGDEARDRVVEALRDASLRNYYVIVPIEVRSDGLMNYLLEARNSLGNKPTEKILHSTPPGFCGNELTIEALLGVPDGGQAALYWRRQGDGEFTPVSMDVFSNVAEHHIGTGDHQDKNVEYFLYAFDANGAPVANQGTEEQPMMVQMDCQPVGGAAEADPTEVPVEDEPEDGKKKKKKNSGPSALPKGWVNIGLGTGFGLAGGQAEQTYEQYFPRSDEYYNAPHAACAIARWYGGDAGLPSDVELWGNAVDPNTGAPIVDPNSVFGIYAPAQHQLAIAESFDRSACERRHPVSSGMAPALFHIAPEFDYRVGKKISVGVFARLQVATGSSVFRDDPNKQPGDPTTPQPGTSYWDDVYADNPAGVKSPPPFSWAVGARFRYFLGKDDAKFRPWVGALAGYGRARLRVDLGFSDDRNGNSVPDNQEIGADAVDQAGTDCFPVWPYNNSCNEMPGTGDNEKAVLVAQNAESNGNRVDTVAIGPAFVGAAVGFNYQIVKNFAVFGGLDVGLWLPSSTSVLFDLTVGPAITF